MTYHYSTEPRLAGALIGLSILCLGSAIATAILTTQYAYHVAQLAVSKGVLTDRAFVLLFVQGPASITILALIVAGLEIVSGLLLLSFRGMYLRRELVSARRTFIVISALLLAAFAVSLMLFVKLLQVFSLTGLLAFCYVGVADIGLSAVSASASMVLTRMCIVEIEKFAGLRRPRRQVLR